MPRGQKGGSGGLRQQPNAKKRKGGENKRMFKKPKTADEKGAAPKPAKGVMAAAKDPVTQHAYAAAMEKRGEASGVKFSVGKGKESKASDLLEANREMLANFGKPEAAAAAAGNDSDNSDDEDNEDPQEQAEREGAIAHHMVSQAGWAPLSQRLNPVGKSFDTEFKEEWDGMPKDEREEYVRIDGLEVAAAKKKGLIVEKVVDTRLEMSTRDLRAKVREMGVDEATIDAAIEGKFPKKSLIRLIDANEAKAAEVAAAAAAAEAAAAATGGGTKRKGAATKGKAAKKAKAAPKKKKQKKK